jgi:hypothetical protein
MIKSIILIPFFYWIHVLPTNVLEKSVEEINNRYSETSSYKLVEKVNSLSEEGAIRVRFYKSVLKESGIIDPIIIIEYSSSGEAFSYNSRVIGYNKHGALLKLDYSFYSNREKVKVKRLRNSVEFNQEIAAIRSVEYDNEEKLPFPSDVVLVSYTDGSSKWQFRLSESPTAHAMKIISLM